MIWIDLEHKRPTDVDLPPDIRWSQLDWDAWLAKSKQLVDTLAMLNAAGKREERNDLIDSNRAHWSVLRNWMLTLSGGKCWFSEVREKNSHYEVEHFRPKKEAKALDGTSRDGYWWLAFDYMNFRVCTNVPNRMKGGWFPLKSGSLCSSYSQQCEESETRYLLDPVDASDVVLISFDEEGKVVPTPGSSLWEQERVVETVKRLKLNEHAPLAESRRKVWQKVNQLIEDFRTAKGRLNVGNNPAAKAKFTEVCSKIREATKVSEELSSVARWCLLLRNDPHLSMLLR
jgi:hypothetical protein